MQKEETLYQKFAKGFGIPLTIDITVWINTEEKYLEPCATRINRRLKEDNVEITDVCRFTKFVENGKSRPGRINEIYYYGMRIRLYITEEQYQRVKDAIEK